MHCPRVASTSFAASPARGFYCTNGQELWDEVRLTVSDFLLTIWRDGRLLGRTADEAFFVRCDIDAGRLIVLIGFAPLRPAEFLIIRITLDL